MTSLFSHFYFEPVNLLIITGCCKSSTNIAQISPILHKINPHPTLSKKDKIERNTATRARICLVQSRFLISTLKDGKLAANYNYNHYNLSFSHIIITVIISEEDMLFILTCCRLSFIYCPYFCIILAIKKSVIHNILQGSTNIHVIMLKITCS